MNIIRISNIILRIKCEHSRNGAFTESSLQYILITKFDVYVKSLYISNIHKISCTRVGMHVSECVL